MKKKRLFIFVALVSLLVACALLSTQFGVKREKEIVVAKPIIEVSPVITDLKNWPKWFVGADKYQFHIISSSPAGVTVRTMQGSIQSINTIVAYPDSTPSNTHLTWTSVESGFDWLKQTLFYSHDDPQTRLAQLKGYLESNREFYGFDIDMEKVEDTLVLTKEVRIKKSELVSTLRRVFKELENFAARDHLETNIDSCRMATFYDESKDSIHMAAGVPVSGKPSRAADGIRLLEMPARGKMLVGKYRGPYKGLSKLYRAMRRYAFDKKLVVVGAVYEKYLGRAETPADSLNMTIELHFPVL